MATFVNISTLSKLAQWEGNLGFTVGELTLALDEGVYYKNHVDRQNRDILFLQNIAHIPFNNLSEPRKKWLIDIQTRVGSGHNSSTSNNTGSRAVIFVPNIMQ